MTFHLTDDELHTLIANNPSDPRLLKELRYRVRWTAIKAMPSPVGCCNAGLPIGLDNKGPMSTGEIYHRQGYSTCTHGVKEWAYSPRRERLRRIAEETRDV